MSHKGNKFYPARRRRVNMPKLNFDSIDFSSFRKLEYPIPHEGGSVDTPCVIQPGETGLSKASDAIIKAMDKQSKRFPF